MTAESSTISALDWLVIAVYVATMILMGWRAGRKNKTLEDYFVGGRNVSSFAAGISLLATLLSSISYLSTPGEVIANGTGFCWELVAVPVVFVVVGYFLVPHIMALPVNSAYELLETRLGPQIRTLAACLFVLIRLLWMAMVLHTCATATAVFTGFPREWLVCGLGVITLIYTTEGGIRAVIWTDVAQFFILLGGAVFTVLFLMHTGGFGAGQLAQQAWESARTVPAISFDPTQRISVLNIAFSAGLWWIATCGSDQVAMQRFFTTRDAPAARRSFLINLIANAVTMLVLTAIGLALLNYYALHPQLLPENLRDLRSSGDKIFPHYIIHGLPAGLSGLVIAALFAAAMSSLSSGFNSISTVLTVDFFQRGAAAKAAMATSLTGRRRAQVLTVIVGVLVIGAGFLVPFVHGNFFEKTNRLLNPLGGPLFGLFALAFFDRRASPFSAWSAFLIGSAAAFFIAYGHILMGSEKPFSFAWIMPASITATIAFGILTSRILSVWFGNPSATKRGKISDG